MIRVRELTKTYGRVRAVDGATFTAQPGRVTGFLGLNGSGKTTTLRMLLGLTRATSGEALINDRRYRDLKHPPRQVGAVLEQGLSHPGQTARAHLATQALLAGVNRSRVDALLDHVGLAGDADRRTGDYSLGMRQRLAVATALLGDPPILVLDEPANGGLGAFAIAVMGTAQHHQHRTAVLLYLGQPRRWLALAGQAVAAAVAATAVAAVSGATVLASGSTGRFTATLAVVPLMALYGAFNATVVRRPTWLFIGYAGWFIFVEGLVGKLELPLPVTAFLGAGGGDHRDLAIFAGWTALAMVAAAVAVRRDLTAD